MRNFTYLITSEALSLVVDPQPELTLWQECLEKRSSKLAGILLTHTHYDHVGGVQKIVEQYQTPVYLHILDSFRLVQWDEKIQNFFRYIEDGDELPLGSLKIKVIHTPGHSAGEVCYYVKEKNEGYLFTGDTVFVGDVGRTDLETGSTEELFTSLQKLKRLPSETIIYPGHHYGLTPTTTLARECRESKAFQCRTSEELHAIP